MLLPCIPHPTCPPTPGRAAYPVPLPHRYRTLPPAATSIPATPPPPLPRIRPRPHHLVYHIPHSWFVVLVPVVCLYRAVYTRPGALPLPPLPHYPTAPPYACPTLTCRPPWLPHLHIPAYLVRLWFTTTYRLFTHHRTRLPYRCCRTPYHCLPPTLPVDTYYPSPTPCPSHTRLQLVTHGPPPATYCPPHHTHTPPPTIPTFATHHSPHTYHLPHHPPPPPSPTTDHHTFDSPFPTPLPFPGWCLLTFLVGHGLTYHLHRLLLRSTPHHYLDDALRSAATPLLVSQPHLMDGVRGCHHHPLPTHLPVAAVKAHAPDAPAARTHSIVDLPLPSITTASIPLDIPTACLPRFPFLPTCHTHTITALPYAPYRLPLDYSYRLRTHLVHHTRLPHMCPSRCCSWTPPPHTLPHTPACRQPTPRLPTTFTTTPHTLQHARTLPGLGSTYLVLTCQVLPATHACYHVAHTPRYPQLPASHTPTACLPPQAAAFAYLYATCRFSPIRPSPPTHLAHPACLANRCLPQHDTTPR